MKADCNIVIKQTNTPAGCPSCHPAYSVKGEMHHIPWTCSHRARLSSFKLVFDYTCWIFRKLA